MESKTKINFHMHSTASDGALSPSEVIDVMNQASYSLIALTDHDTVSGIKEARESCKKHGIDFISGVEITTFIPEELGILDDSYKIHLLGLGIQEEAIENFLNRTVKLKNEYHMDIMRSYGLSPDEIAANCKIDNRVSCAEYLVHKKIKDTIDDALLLFRMSKYAPDIKESIFSIKKAGGIAIWAHPFILPRNGAPNITRPQFDTIYEYMKAVNIDGLEGYYLQFSNQDQKYLSNKCIKDGFFCSTGTDFHGDYSWEYDLLRKTGDQDNNLITTLYNKIER